MENSDPREQNLDAWLALTGKGSPHRGPVQLPVLSGSMLPAIPPEAILEIELAASYDYRIGDVVVFQDNADRLTAHRVLACLKIGPFGWVLQKGDNNDLGHWIRKSRVRGLVSRVIPGDAGEDAGRDSARHEPVTSSDNPYSLSAARASRRQHFRNLALKWPRRIRAFLFPTSRPRP
ncbi:MAG: hypothetical protein KOO60_09960 [Gemmatimonadales bacterium]|nr:hypothetical protein [Gemmatimonadales bacterium]